MPVFPDVDNPASQIQLVRAADDLTSRVDGDSRAPSGNKQLAILGIRGIPACHGGFETFAERLATDFVGRGWDVTVYCQEQGKGAISESRWQGVRRVHIPVSRSDALGTIAFDWKSIRHAGSQRGVILTLGYNTTVFNALLARRGRANLINMDGIEWQRTKWSWPARCWFYLNERAGCRLGTHLIADHPEIAAHLSRRTRAERITMIPYGADAVAAADAEHLAPWNLTPRGYTLVIARPEPENSVLEIVSAFSRRQRDHRLVVLGNYEPADNAYHRSVLEAASTEVVFPGAIYEKEVVAALRYHAQLYVHGHTVGGTNPALVEALGAGAAVLAHDNRFNRWVAGTESRFFTDSDECSRMFDQLLTDTGGLERMRSASRARHQERFTWPMVLDEYEALLSQYVEATQIV